MARHDASLLVRIARLALAAGAARGLLGAALCALAAAAGAQDTDLTLPPRFEESPGETRLAAPPPARPDSIEEVVAIGENKWRLPDLGSTWRANAAAEQSTKRIAVAWLPIYDPARPGPNFDPLQMNRELRRVGFIEVFRVRFGRRASD